MQKYQLEGFFVSTNCTKLRDYFHRRVGTRCNIVVQPTRYDFISKHARNFGQRVQGVKFTALDLMEI
jgi:hypothetical protein